MRSLLALSCIVVPGVAASQPAGLPDRGALVATSRTFAFYSDPVTNLHDFLAWNARSPEPVEPKPACLAGLSAEQRDAFEHARDYYAKTFANGQGELVLLSIRKAVQLVAAPPAATP